MRNTKRKNLQEKIFVKQEESKSSTMAEIIPLAVHRLEKEFMKLNIKEIVKASAFLFGTLFISRLIGLPANFTPIIATAVCLPMFTDNKNFMAMFLISLMFLTDLFLGMYSLAPLVYGVIASCSLMSTKIPNKYYAGALGVGVWHVVVNGAVYLNGHGSTSLAQTYLQAIPFDFKLLVSTLLFVSLYDATQRLWQTVLQEA